MAVPVVAALLLLISPAIFTVGWHVIHGNAIETRGHRIHVPLGWTADTDRLSGVWMTKLSLTVIRGIRLSAMISIGHTFSPSKENPTPNYDSWEKRYWNFAEPGAVVEGPIRMGSGNREVLCMESSYPKAPRWQTASCLMLQGTWSAEFMGDKNDAKVFFDTVQKFN